MAEKINAKLGYRPIQAVEEEKEPEAPPAETFKRYEEELEINDFPQTARWKVTSKASRSHIHRQTDRQTDRLTGRLTDIQTLRGGAGDQRLSTDCTLESHFKGQ